MLCAASSSPCNCLVLARYLTSLISISAISVTASGMTFIGWPYYKLRSFRKIRIITADQ